MELVPFYIRFPDLAEKETRSIFIFKSGDLPPGQYGFLELFCDDPKCDCRRVVISVISPQRGTAPLATRNGASGLGDRSVMAPAVPRGTSSRR